MTLTPEQARELAHAALEPVAADGVTGPAATGNGGQEANGGLATRIGRYSIIRLINAGGMGEVFEADQDEPRRVVALKLMRPDLVSPQATRRFQYEAELLGRLHHPGIARVYDAGRVETENGPRHYFAMELVRGKQLTAYVAEESLSMRQRLDLFLRVCDAVEHAHRKGVIHRDLKPGNILVDEAGEPKVLDFGVARSTDADIQVTTMLTDIGQLIGTLPYMSPEQVAGDPEELDTRSDVYSLGVVLYQMLSGRLPYEVSKAAIPEAVRTIREDEPSRLSSIDKSLRGDVETIVAKALEKEPERRYQSASDLAADIRRYLGSEPIVARRASTWYQVRRFAGRNKGFSLAVTAAAVSMMVGISFSAWQASNAIFARRAADIARASASEQADLAERERREAVAQMEIAKAVTQFLREVLSSSSPNEEGRDVKVLDVLTKAADRISTDPPASDDALAAIYSILGDAFFAIGQARAALPHHRTSLQMHRRLYGDHHDVTVRMTVDLAQNLKSLGQFDKARKLCEDALDHWSDREGDEAMTNQAVVENTLASIMAMSGKFDEAERLYLTSMQTYVELFGPNHERVLDSMCDLGKLYWRQQRVDEAEEMLRVAIERQIPRYGPDDLRTIHTQGAYALVLLDRQRWDEAASLLQTIVSVEKQVLGGAHPDYLTSLGNLGYALSQLSRLDEARDVLMESYLATAEVLGEDHYNTIIARAMVGEVARKQGDVATAEEIARDVLRQFKETLGTNSPLTTTAMTKLIGALDDAGKYNEAVSIAEEHVILCKETHGERRPMTIQAMAGLGHQLLKARRVSDAIEVLERTCVIGSEVLGENHVGLHVSRQWLAEALTLEEDFGTAEVLLNDCFSFFVEQFPKGHKRQVDCAWALEALYVAKGDMAKAQYWRQVAVDGEAN